MRRLFSSLFLLTIDTIIIMAAAFIAVFLRFDGDVPHRYLNYTVISLPALIVIRLGVFYFFRLYNRIWRYASIREFSAIVGAGIAGSFIFYLWLAISGNSYALPRSVHVISSFLVIGGVGASRLAIRIYSHYRSRLAETGRKTGGCGVLIVGAGDAGAIIAREILQGKQNGKQIVGFIDDDKRKQGMVMFGSKILGDRGKIAEIVQKQTVEEIIIAMPSVGGKEIREIIDICRDTGCETKIVPSIYELIDGTFTLDQIRKVDVEDLLRRDPVQLDEEVVKGYLLDKRILITGAGGSIGLEICRQVAKLKPGNIILLGKGENSIYEACYDLTKKFPEVKITPIIADVRDSKRISCIFERLKPQVVFHAAAHKHVPLMEAQPVEAVQNNIIGTKVVAEAAIKYGAERFIMVSTDKAVNPTSVMGATKRVAEMLVSSIGQNSETIFAAVRFGNVLGSRGSVIPLFKKQIAAGGPVTVTHPEMKRYFMTIPEASQLVLQAGSMAKGGEVFVLDMGEPIKIVNLAEDLIRLSGFTPGEDITIEFTGLRPGEKLFEELLTAEEGTSATENKKIFVANMKKVAAVQLLVAITEMEKHISPSSIIDALAKTVPFYVPNRNGNNG